MTFQFTSVRRWSGAQTVAMSSLTDVVQTNASRRLRLVARWQRGEDGHLECRWYRSPD
jgi:hypothetical protein